MVRWRCFSSLFLVLLAVSCQTPADRWISEHYTAEEKAGLLVEKAQRTFEAMVDRDDLSDLPVLRAALQLAQETAPGNTKVRQASQQLELYVTQKRTDSQATVRTLTAKPSLTDKEKYRLVVLLRQLEQLSAAGLDLSKLNAQTAGIRAEVVKKTAETLVVAEKAVLAARTDTETIRSVASTAAAIEALRQVQGPTPEVNKAVERLAAYVVSTEKTGLELVAKAVKLQDYSSASKALAQVTKLYAAAAIEPGPALDGWSYRIALEWARVLFNAKKYAEASSRISDALAVQSTAEALDLRDKITQAATFRDWDGAYDDLDRQIEALIRGGDWKTAWNSVVTTTQRLTKEENKTRIAARRKQILDGVHELYDRSVAAYNEEDFPEAKTGFETVVAVDPSWKLSRAYLEKVKGKLQALGTP